MLKRSIAIGRLVTQERVDHKECMKMAKKVL